MKQFFLLLLLSVFSLAAADFTVPRHTSWVVDEAQVFSKEERNRILSAIQKLEKATDGGQMAVVTLKSLNGISIEEAGIKIADAWKVGNRGKDDGAILIIVPSCKMLSPILDQVAAEIGDKALILKANVDDVQQQTVKFGVRNIPAIFILKDGTVVKQFNGVQDKATLIKAIEDAANA